MKKNSFWIVIIMAIVLIFVRRYTYLPGDIVSFPDSQIIFDTQDKYIEQTWQPDVKILKQIQMPYCAENDFVSDIQLKVFNDDYSEMLIETTVNGYEFNDGQMGSIDFQFDRTRIVPGDRYRIQISLLNASADGSLKIEAGSNYGGCSIDGEETGAAIDLVFTTAKFSKLFWMTAVLFPLLTFSLFLMILLGRKFEEVVAVSMCTEGLIMFVFGMMEHLVWGLNLVYFLAIALFVVSIFLYNKKGVDIKELFSPGLLIYFAFFILIVLTSHGDWLGERDDLRHWGSAVRDMFYYDSLAKHIDTTVILPRYFPFAALIEYIFVFMNGLYSEDILLIAMQTMELSVLIILCKPLQKLKDINKLLPILVMMVCVPVIFFNEISSILMVDPLQMALMVYILICYYTEESKFNYVRILISAIVITAIKDIGMVFAGLMLLIIFGDTVIKQIKEKQLNIKKLVYPIVGVVIVLATYMSWQIYLSKPAKSVNEVKVATVETAVEIAPEVVTEVVKENIKQQKAVASEATGLSASGISVSGIVDVLSGNGKEYQYVTTRNFIIALLEEGTYSIGEIKISFIDMLMVIAFIILSLGFFGYWGNRKTTLCSFAAMEIVAGIALCLFLQITYWFTFPDYEAVILASMSRYLAPYLCALTITLLYLMLEFSEPKEGKENNIKYIIYALSTFLVISMPVKNLVIENHEAEGNTVEEITYGHSDITKLLRSVAKKGDKVQFVCSGSDGYSEYIFRNAVCPIISEHSWWFSVGTKEIWLEQQKIAELDGEEYFADVVSIEQMANRLRDYQYVVVFHADEGFIQSYAEIFRGAENIIDGSIYEVKIAQDGMHLELIGTTGIMKWR